GQHGGGWGCPAGEILSPPPTPGTGGVAGDGGGWADQAAQQKLNAQLTRAWCRRMAMSERTWNLRWPRDGGSRRSSVTESNSIFRVPEQVPAQCALTRLMRRPPGVAPSWTI